MRTTALLPAALVLPLAFSLSSSPTRALGPVDVEVTALYWMSDSELGGVSEDSKGPGVRGELWIKRLGFAAHSYKLDPDTLFDGESLTSTAADVKFRLISVAENSFLAAGVGYGTMDLSGPGSGETSGLRLVAEGRIGLVGILYGYGRAAYLPSLDDWEVEGATLTDGDGREVELGVMVQPFPFLQLFGGYRNAEASFDLAGAAVDLKSDGIVVGVGVKF